jgi:hypothetical protein
MPAILDPDSYDLWLDPGMRDVAAVPELLKPYDARLMWCCPVSTRVNHVANDDEECSARVGLAQIQNDLYLIVGSAPPRTFDSTSEPFHSASQTSL